MKLLTVLVCAVTCFAQLPPTPVGARAIVTFAPGLALGGGVLSYRAQICSTLNTFQSLDAGWVEQAAMQAGVAVVGPTEAQLVNTQKRNHTKPIVAANLAQGAGYIGIGLIAMKLVAASSPWGAGLVFGTQGVAALATFLKSQAPPDFGTRFAGSDVMADNSSIDLQPYGAAHSCAVRVVFAHKKYSRTVPTATKVANLAPPSVIINATGVEVEKTQALPWQANIERNVFLANAVPVEITSSGVLREGR